MNFIYLKDLSDSNLLLYTNHIKGIYSMLDLTNCKELNIDFVFFIC